jgi:hypothetical protein
MRWQVAIRIEKLRKNWMEYNTYLAQEEEKIISARNYRLKMPL